MTRKLRIELNKDTCVANLSCINIDPSHFAIKDKKAYMINGKLKDDISYIELNLSDEEAKRVIEAAKSCPTNSIKVIDLNKKEVIVSDKVEENNIREIEAKYDDSKEFVLDPTGYFLIRINKEKKLNKK